MNNICLMYFEGILVQEIQKACSDLQEVGLECESCKIPPPGPQNSIELFIPAAIILFIAKPYLQGFLGEMGKDHYTLLKKGLVKLWVRFFGKDSTVPKVTVMDQRKCSEY